MAHKVSTLAIELRPFAPAHFAFSRFLTSLGRELNSFWRSCVFSGLLFGLILLNKALIANSSVNDRVSSSIL